jgi:hypothetical protein
METSITTGAVQQQTTSLHNSMHNQTNRAYAGQGSSRVYTTQNDHGLDLSDEYMRLPREKSFDMTLRFWAGRESATLTTQVQSPTTDTHKDRNEGSSEKIQSLPTGFSIVLANQSSKKTSGTESRE